jgi:hypothetical protein
MAANRYAIKPSETVNKTMLVMSQPRQEARVELAQDEEPGDRREIDGVVHDLRA